MRQKLFDSAGHRLFFLLGTITLLLATAMTVAVLQFRAYSHVFANTHDVLNAITSLESSMTRAETSARAYFLTGDDGFRKEFADSRNAAIHDRDTMRSLIADMDQEKPRVVQLSETLTQRLEHLAKTVARRQSAAVPLPNGEHHDEGRRMGSEISRLIGVEKTNQARLLAERRARRREIESAVLGLCITCALVSLSLVLVGMRAMRNDLRLRDQAQEALRKSNAELEQRVLDRTASIQQANAELQRSQNDLRAIAAALERSNTDLESFAYAATHDLQEPLRTIALFAQLLKKQTEETPDADPGYYLQTIIAAAERMFELISGMLEYSRVSRDPSKPSEVVDLNHVVTEVEENLSAQISESGAKIFHDPLPSLTGNHLHLTQLMQNLIGNSIKYRSSERACEIRIQARRENGHWAISVRDNGLGFKAEYHKYIFGMFKRLDRARAGAGVGLATCQTIIERYGGKIWAESEEGRGATFHFIWPEVGNNSSAT
jgi:signal transduction histidine kinase